LVCGSTLLPKFAREVLAKFRQGFVRDRHNLKQ
jgi:hypothetical protein